MVEIIESKREGRSYNTLSIKFESLGDLNSLVNTPQMLSGLLGLFVPGTSIPPIFTEFIIMSDEIEGHKTFHMSAEMDANTTEILRFANITIHARLPLDVESHNAPIVRNNELSWPVEPGETLEISATATDSAGLDIPTRGIMLDDKYGVFAISIVVVIVVVIAVYLLYRRSHSPDDDVQTDW